jgi:hypothetical protein
LADFYEIDCLAALRFAGGNKACSKQRKGTASLKEKNMFERGAAQEALSF